MIHVKSSEVYITLNYFKQEKMYYTITYKENGEWFTGFGSYNIEIVEKYLKDYFIIEY